MHLLNTLHYKSQCTRTTLYVALRFTGIFVFILAYPSTMYQSILALMITALCVDSLTVYGSGNIFVFNMPDQEGGGNFREPPPHSEVAKMARYIVHNSGKVK
jgi:hypothetical protein